MRIFLAHCKVAIINRLSRTLGFFVRRWCPHDRLESVESHVIYITTWRSLLTKEEGCYSESEGKFRCRRCNRIVLGRFRCLTEAVIGQTDDDDDIDEDEDEDEDPNTDEVNV